MRLWNIVEYWYPYRDQLDGSWESVLREFVPRLAMASTAESYRLELIALMARVTDTHANLWSGLDARPPRGRCSWPVALRHVEDRFVVFEYLDRERGARSGLEIGDVVMAVDGQPVDSLARAWTPLYAASNDAARMRDMARRLPYGACGASTVTIERAGATRELVVARDSGLGAPRFAHDRPGDTLQMLSPGVAYLTLSRVHAADVPSYIERAGAAPALVIDLRNYPSEFVVFALGSRLVDTLTAFARFASGDPANPGAFVMGDSVRLAPERPGYRGRIAILVDEMSQSQAEYTAMALRAAPGAVVVGSTTAGADGDVSPIPMPGGQRAMISGIGVFYPDGRPTQRIGIVPDIVARPTIAGIRDGRDEVLEVALRALLGPQVDEARIREMARRN
jgi:C-terminal processing protease CtpA/Prc